ncbi:hypothetical protein EZV73_22670 [Acidaminobacter sp. JC074]|uniref:hypothetical protein n=1 Tax=Acidaminobacter sp. JC074 TaxID=2530199 RepID=UPI001F0D0FD1|nr:hypothetical protein [Acidaminobacter sp. JC074]MCH4890405.1 hypothetical protein [Acidaminobacter sp. JC074]
MKLIKAVVAIMLAIIFAFITRYYMSSINMQAVTEFTPFPHFFPTTEMSYKVSLFIFFAVYLGVFSALVMKKFFLFGFSAVGIVMSLIKYRAVTTEFLPVDMVFVPALLELGKTLSIFIGIGIVLQLIVDGALGAIRLVNKNKK